MNKKEKFHAPYVTPRCISYKMCVSSALMIDPSLQNGFNGGHNPAPDDPPMDARQFVDLGQDNGSAIYSWE